MLSCQRASQLISDGLNRRLSMGERISLRFHTFVCAACRTYRRQLAVIHRAMMQHGLGDADSASEFADVKLSAEARDRIRKALDQRL